MCKNLFHKVPENSVASFCVLFLFVFLLSIFTISTLFAHQVSRKQDSKGRAYTKRFKQSFSRAGSVVNVSPQIAEKRGEEEVTIAVPKVDEKALNEAKAIRNARTSELTRLKKELSELQAEMKNSGQCTVDGRQITIKQYRAQISYVKAFSKTDKVAKINASISDKKNVIADLEKRIAEKEATAQKMIAGTVATSTLAVAGTAGLGVAIADLVKTKMSIKKLQNGEKVCGKYGLLVK